MIPSKSSIEGTDFDIHFLIIYYLLFPISLYEIFLYMRDSFKILFILSNKLNKHTKIIIDSIN